jgi:hypothetical protein
VTTPMARHRSVAFVVTPIPLCGCYVEVNIALIPNPQSLIAKLIPNPWG